MKRKEMTTPVWVVDYSAARAHAIRWLGDRYLLARPINASRFGPRPLAPGIIVPPENPDPLVPLKSH